MIVTGTLQNERNVCGSLRYTTDFALLEHDDRAVVAEDLARVGDHREQPALLGHLRDVADRQPRDTTTVATASTIATERRCDATFGSGAARERVEHREREQDHRGEHRGRNRRAAQTWSGVIVGRQMYSSAGGANISVAICTGRRERAAHERDRERRRRR